MGHLFSWYSRLTDIREKLTHKFKDWSQTRTQVRVWVRDCTRRLPLCENLTCELSQNNEIAPAKIKLREKCLP